MKSLSLLSGVFLASMLVSCSGENKPADTAATEQSAPAAETTAPDGDTVEIVLEANDQMQFNKNDLYANEGQKVILTLKHVGTAPKTSMGHNFVLLKEGTDSSLFGQKAAAAADNDYIPASEEGSIIAHTKMLGGGESDTIEFTAPKAGIYTFLCSFPGHYAVMKGSFIVR